MKDIGQDWERLLTDGRVLPFFQPVISLESKSVAGYECLGRLDLDGKMLSLGNFFQAKTLHRKGVKLKDSEAKKWKMEIDSSVRDSAIEKFALWNDSSLKLFINSSPAFLAEELSNVQDNTSEFMKLTDAFGVDPQNIVIEITEDAVEQSLDDFKPLINLYKRKGYFIAIDDLGKNSSNLDRIALFRPDIVKVDMHMLQRALEDQSYQEILHSLARLTQNLGISLLYEGVENSAELLMAMGHGSRYLQGYFFSEPVSDFIDKDNYARHLESGLSRFMENISQKIAEKVGWEKRILDILNQMHIDTYSVERNFPELEKIFRTDASIFRFFVTDLFGNQISPNFVCRTDFGIETDYSSLKTNWCWRPYFINHVYHSRIQYDTWIVSEAYHDIREEKILRTFSRTIAGKYYIFIDVDYGLSSGFE